MTQAKGSKINPGGLKSKSLKDITGKLEITGPQQKNAAATSGFSFDLPALERIGNISVTGSLLFNDGDMLHTFNSPRASVSNVFISGLRGDFISDIKTIPTELRASGADNLLTASLPSLDSLGALILTNNPRLTSVSAPALTTAQRIEIHSTGRASKLVLPDLATLGNSTAAPGTGTRPAALILRDLADIQLPALRATHPSMFSSGSIEITLGAFRTLALPALESITSGGLRIASNSILDSVALPRLVSVGGRLNISDNENLVEFKANALKTVESVRLEGNFTKVEMFGLQTITNGFYLAGDRTMDCSWFDDNLPGGMLKAGSYECRGNHTRPEKTREPTKDDGDKGVLAPVKEEEVGLSGKARVGLGVGLGVLAAVVGLGVWAWWKRRRQIQFEREREVAIGLESRGGAGLGYRGAGGYNPLQGGREMRDASWGSGKFAGAPPTPSPRISEMDGLLPRRELAG